MTQCNGSCQCGKVSIQANIPEQWYHACHCGMCRKLTGGPLMGVHAGKDVVLSGEEHITLYDSSDWMERGFCKHCGSQLFVRLKENKEYFIPVWLFDNAKDFAFALQIFTDNKPESYSFANETQNMTEAEVLAKFST